MANDIEIVPKPDLPTEGWIEVFSVGEHTASNGKTFNYTEEIVDTIVNNYNKSVEEGGQETAPVVIGHPVDSSPAYGWVSKLRRVGDKMEAYLVKLQPSFVQAVEDGLYKMRSISVDLSNFLLEHVGFLGGVPPAVKGLAPVQFHSGTHSFCSEEKIGGKLKFEVTLPPTVPPVTPVDTPAVANTATRQQAYGIEVKPKLSRDAQVEEKDTEIFKPLPWAELTDEQFADPVNYRFPLADKAQALMSAALFRDWSVQDQYTLIEKQLIGTRIFDALLSLGCTPDEVEKWKYMFSKATGKAGKRSYSTTTLQGKKMDIFDKLEEWVGTTYNPETQAQLTAFDEQQEQAAQQAVIDFCTQTFGQEVGDAVKAKIAELVTAEPEPAAPPATPPVTAAAPPAPVTPAVPAAHAAMSARIEVLETEARVEKYSSFAESLIAQGKLVPAQKQRVVERLNVAFRSDAAKITTNEFETVKKELEAAPKVVNFNDVANHRTAAHAGATKSIPSVSLPDNANVDKDSLAQAEKISKYAAEKKLTYSQAYNELAKSGSL